MSYHLKNKFVSKELEDEIILAVKERRSVEQLLIEKGFTGTSDALEELVHILAKCMGVAMALEFIFTANQGEWENYRNALNELWNKISISESFNTINKLLLGQFLHQRGQKDLGMKFIRRAAVNADDVKTSILVAEVVNREIGNKAWVKEILLGAKEISKTADDYAKISKRFIEFLDDKDESKKAIERSIKKAETFPEFCGAAVAVLRSFGDRKWAELVYEMGLPHKDPSSSLDKLADEEYKEITAMTTKQIKIIDESNDGNRVNHRN